MNRPRLIATDLDGTLLRRGGILSDRTLRALRGAFDAGAEVVFVTARPPRFVDMVVAATGLVGTAVCSNGALLYDVAARTVVETRPLPVPTARQVAAALSVAAPGLGFAVETGHQVLYEPRFGLRFPGAADAEVAVASLMDLWLADVPITKLLAWSAQLDADFLLAAAEASAGGVAQFTHSGGAGLLEISAPGVTKAGTLSVLCAARGIDSSDVVAFGDMPNDLAILQWAGSGYAMANAHPSVLSAVQRHTASNEEDGVAVVLERLFGQC
ncbi:HAD hydrolase family protein [Streptomyces sp. NBC_01142]|uniref:HAD family hydrolase n=1 Tax=Streptomyces sp. NBC_01142 TaxID=2975865 RepID=UPI00224E7E80|nr:HAD hydrolase family protein [Streptomyces sp. NBC_01142]MCX4825510.1 HAD hydrolase family protein [Streptomyces sp. NBC_01142]